ncbi:hypothetical protein [Streptomyces sp. NPDC018059]|uniref:hypothetical protein n=1 Tax=Streptomyces sp. NPDC018059 TaxID=3365041 RepID=UPI0037B78CB6
MAREIRFEVSDEAFEQLERVAAKKRVAAEEYAGQVLDRDLARVRFMEAARSFVAQHAAGFAERFGGPVSHRADAA